MIPGNPIKVSNQNPFIAKSHLVSLSNMSYEDIFKVAATFPIGLGLLIYGMLTWCGFSLLWIPSIIIGLMVIGKALIMLRSLKAAGESATEGVRS